MAATVGNSLSHDLHDACLCSAIDDGGLCFSRLASNAKIAKHLETILYRLVNVVCSSNDQKQRFWLWDSKLADDGSSRRSGRCCDGKCGISIWEVDGLAACNSVRSWYVLCSLTRLGCVHRWPPELV